MSIKYNESLSKKLNYHQKQANAKTSVSTGNTYSSTLKLSTKGITKIPSVKRELTERNNEDDSIKNTIQSVNDRKENINTINFQNAELNTSFDKPNKFKLIVNDIDDLLEEESKKAFEKIDNVMILLQNPVLKSPQGRKNDKYSELRALKEENDILINNINILKQEHSQIIEKYNKLKGKYNINQKHQNTNESMKYQELYEMNSSLQQQNKVLEKKLKTLVNVLNTELEEKNKISKSIGKVPSKKNLIDDKASYLLGATLKKNQAIENIEKEIMINKLNSLKKEIMLKDKEIAMLTQSFVEKDHNEIESEEDLRFEESYNVTNISDNNTLNNEYNNNLAEDNISGSDIDKNNEYNKVQVSSKPLFDISLKRFEKNKQIKHLSENVVDDEKDARKMSKLSISNVNTSKSGAKLNIKSNGKNNIYSDTYRKFLK